ncbi:MAG TPA: hypothetical protein VKK79_16620 [Candidatus Lokiarchaeia archaeon]|nr:hypothetical protein [Candidatus Lokiarchaeia archaeon]
MPLLANIPGPYYWPFESMEAYMLTIMSPLMVALSWYCVYLYLAVRAPPFLKKCAPSFASFLKSLPGIEYDALDLFEALGISSMQALAADFAAELSAILQLDIGIVEQWILLARKAIGLLPNKLELVDLNCELCNDIDENAIISSIVNSSP